MTKYLDYAFLSAALLATLPACTSESNDPDPVNEVRFSATENTRSTLVTNTSLTSFTVYGNMVSTSSSSTPSVVFDGTNVNKTDGKWAYENVQYWIPGKTYSFAAIHLPSNDNISNLSYSNDKLTFDYTAPDDYSAASDILTAGHRRVYTYSATTAASSVAFNFDHIMSRVNFVANVESTASIHIDQIKISGVVSTASYNLQAAPLIGGSKQTSDLSGPAWVIPQNPTQITITKAVDAEITGGSSLSLFPADDPLLIIPQSVSTDIIVELTYTTADGQSVATGRLRNSTSSHNYTWTAGQSYTYSFTLGADEYLLFDKPVVEAWNEGPGGSYYIID